MTTTMPEAPPLSQPEHEVIDLTEFETELHDHIYSLRDWQQHFIYDRQHGDVHAGIEFRPNRPGTATYVIREDDWHVFHLCHPVSFNKGDTITVTVTGVCQCGRK